jgi:hypothetical protein
MASKAALSEVVKAFAGARVPVVAAFRPYYR